MTNFTKDQVRHLGELVCIALSDEEVEILQGDLNSIAEALYEIQQIDTTGVEPTTNPLIVTEHLRDDVPQPTLPREELLKQAPDTKDGMFVAPRILGSE